VLLNDQPTWSFLGLIFEPLIETNPLTLEPVGALAEAWEVSSDGLTWTFFLREGVTWHDGKPFTAEDVRVTYEMHLNPDTGSSYTGDLDAKIDEIEVVDEHTVRFHLPSPLADFAVDVAIYFIVPAHIWDDVAGADVRSHPGATGLDPALVVGTGRFQFEEWTSNERAVAVRYDDYWGGRPHLDEIIFKVIPDQSAGVAQLRTGEIDWLGNVPPASINELTGADVEVFNFSTLSFSFYATNLDPERTTLFQDVEVRQALMHALDREAMVEGIYFGYAEVAVGTMPTMSWAYNPDEIEHPYPYDVERAIELLERAGWTPGSDGVRQKDGQRLAFTMHGDAGDPITSQSLTAMQEYWRAIGVEMTPQLEPFQALVERIVTYDFEAFLVGFIWGASPDQWALWGCDAYEGGFNVVRYCNEEVDRLLAAARGEADQQRRIELYTAFQNELLADIPMAVMFFPEGISAVSTRVHNVFPSLVNERFNAETWWVEE
jgi:peptide/nickel transport system substrate-binding protein